MQERLRPHASAPKDLPEYGDSQYGDAPTGLMVAGLLVAMGISSVIDRIDRIRASFDRKTVGKKGPRITTEKI